MSHPRIRRFLAPAVSGVMVACATASSRPPDRSGDFVTVKLETVAIDPAHGSPVVLLRDTISGEVLPILVGVAEAHAIARALHKIEPPRPMTHDLLAALVRTLGAQVIEVQVHALREGTYYGRVRVRLRGEQSVREVDSRPSDALALALRVDAPIRVLRSLLRDESEGEGAPPHADDPVVRTTHRGVRPAAPIPASPT
jgi:hypothetical protein